MKTFIARQPIFTRSEEVLGYEVLFRSGPENFVTDRPVDISAVGVDNFLFFGIERVTSGRLAFVNCSRDFLVKDYLTLLPQDRVVAEILETVSPDDETVIACRHLKDLGYRLALDDFVDSPGMAPLIEIADYLKVDFLATPPAEQERLAKVFSSTGRQLVAEKVETHDDVQRAKDMGYRYLQGYFFCRPEMAERREIAGTKVAYLRILQIANQPDLDVDQLAYAIKQEPSLVYRLLRYLNSPAFPLRVNVTSIPHALALLGEQNIRKWVSLVCLAAMARNKPPELVMVPLVRARFCELLAGITKLRTQAGDLFLMGLLSAMDAILDRPMSVILADIQVDAKIKEALLGLASPFRDLYEVVLDYETGSWAPLEKSAGRLHIDENLLPDLFLRSLDWANQITSIA